jgi:hypothetical protein
LGKGFGLIFGLNRFGLYKKRNEMTEIETKTIEKANRYNNAKIYKIVSDETDEVYYGSTCAKLNRRFAQHKGNFKVWEKDNEKNSYTTSFKIMKYDTAKIILVEDYPCERKEQLAARERFWIESNECVNKVIPTRTIKEYTTIYRQNNKEQLKEKRANYYQSNSEKFKEKSAIYKQNNKEKIREKANQNFDCPCGGRYSHSVISRHAKSKRHQAYEKRISELNDFSESLTDISTETSEE